MPEEAVVDSPTSWVADHIKVYVESDGETGHDWRGFPCLLITTTGRKTGVKRRSALIYGTDGDRYVIMASRGGADEHPQWFLNLRDNPVVELQVLSEKFEAKATISSGAERERLFDLMVQIYPDYILYQQKTKREIPVVILERVAA